MPLLIYRMTMSLKQCENGDKQKIQQDSYPFSAEISLPARNFSFINCRSQLKKSGRINKNNTQILDFQLKLNESFRKSARKSKTSSPFLTFFNPKFRQNLKRSTFISHIWTFSSDFKYKLDTYYMALKYMDSFLSFNEVLSTEIEQLSFVFVTMAAKIIERKSNIYDNIDLLFISSKSLSKEKFAQTELKILEYLNFNLHMKTAYSILTNYLNNNKISTKDFCGTTNLNSSLEIIEVSFNQLVFFFLELTIHEYDFNQFSNEVIAFASILCGRVCVDLLIFNKKIDEECREIFEELLRCIEKMLNNLSIDYQIIFARFQRSIKKLMMELKLKGQKGSTQSENNVEDSENDFSHFSVNFRARIAHC